MWCEQYATPEHSYTNIHADNTNPVCPPKSMVISSDLYLNTVYSMKTSMWIEKDLSGRDSDHRLVMTNKERGENN